MPRCWVKDYFKCYLVDSAERWMYAKPKGNGETRPDIVQAVSNDIKAAILDKHEPVSLDLQKVGNITWSYNSTNYNILLVCQNLVSKSS